MRVAYFDEVKYSPPDQTSFWYGALIIEDTKIRSVEQQINDLSQEFLGSPDTDKMTEIHGSELDSGKGPFKRMKAATRYELLRRLADIIDRPDLFQRVYFRLIPANLVDTKKPYHEIAFMHFLRQVDLALDSIHAEGILIGDFEGNLFVNKAERNVTWYRHHGAKFIRGGKSTNILDTIFFARSHHCRLLQLTDCYLWFCQLLLQQPDYYHKMKLVEYIRTKPRIVRPDRFQIGPTTKSWLPYY